MRETGSGWVGGTGEISPLVYFKTNAHLASVALQYVSIAG